MTAPCFKGFGPQALTFFQGLAAENNRDWFLAHKADYERAVKTPMDLIADLNTAFAARDIPLHGEPKRALFRINRDDVVRRGLTPADLAAPRLAERLAGFASIAMPLLDFGWTALIARS